jgi:hypothetical protein
LPAKPVAMLSLSISPIICFASLKGVTSSIAEDGQVERDIPGISKVVTVKESDSTVATLANELQSPSPEGTRIRFGPRPLFSQYQEIPSSVSMFKEVTMVREIFRISFKKLRSSAVHQVE